jgi:hypothetical protein
MVTKLFTLGQKRPKGFADFKYKGSMDIFKPLAWFSKKIKRETKQMLTPPAKYPSEAKLV